MDSHKKPRSWFSSISSLVGVSRPVDEQSHESSPSTTAKAAQPSSSRHLSQSHTLPNLRSQSRPSLFEAREVFGGSSPPESPVKRASDTTIAQRKILDRPQGPSSRVAGASTKATNFSSATTPRSIFKNSLARDAPAFTFTPRASSHMPRPSFPPDTPGRSYRASASELNSRGMAKTTSSDLFQMKIPEPDAKLTGEVISKQIPKDPNRTGSIYASEYLGHLCPPEFSEAQRNQFFCILDLRRLKYAADDIFQKKDWKLNILNFAKEYEKSRSLIMLRYGLYEFRTVKVSKETFQKWKEANNIPDSEDEAAAAAPATKVNGTEGILRAGKRKAQEDLGPRSNSVNAASNSPQNKRPRAAEKPSDQPAEREPLVESLTPSLNKGKRRAGSFADDVDNQPSAKMPKQAASATRSFFERVANSPAKEPAAATTPSIQVAKPSLDGNASLTKKANPFAKATKPAGSDLARSVLTGGAKLSGQGGAPGNIFGYLSDSSLKGSGNENADADGEDTDSDQEDEEESDPQEAKKRKTGPTGVTSGVSTPGASSIFAQSAGSALASSSSSETGDVGAGRSIFDRVQKDADGQPIRMLSQEASTPPQFGSKPASDAAPSPDKEPTPVPAPAPAPVPTPANQTWTPDTPIKFAPSAAPASSLFGAGAPKAASSSLFGAKQDNAPAPAIKFGSGTPATAVPESNAKSDSFKPLSGSSTPAAPSTGSSLFGAAQSKPASDSDATRSDSAPEVKDKPASTQPQPAAASPFTFGAAKTAKDGPAAPALGSSLQSQTLFGSAPKADASSTQQSPAPSALATDTTKPAEPSANGAAAPAGGFSFGKSSAAPTSNLFGGFKPAAEPPKTPSLFSTPATSQPASAGFSFGAATTGAASQPTAAAATPKPLFGTASTTTPAASAAPKSLFGATTTPAAPSETKAADEDSMQMSPAQTKTVSTDVKPPAAPIFSFGGAASTPSTNLFGASTTAPPASQPKLFGTVNSGNAGPTFNFGGGDSGFKNPFTAGNAGAGATGGINFNFGAAAPASTPGSGQATPFQFGAGNSSAATPAASGSFQFGASPQPEAAPSSNLFGGGATNGASSGGMFNFGGASSQSAAPIFGQQPTQGVGSIFGNSLAPPMGGTSTGTNTPFTTAGASSLATTPATGTPEPAAAPENANQDGQNADGDEAPQEQISLTEGGPGEEGEDVVLEMRAKAMRLTHAKDDTDSESPSGKDTNGKAKSPWKLMGVGPLRLLKDKETGAVRLLLRVLRGDVALNKRVLPEFSYKPEPGGKYVKLTTSDDKGTGLETWMIQLKTKEQATELADALEKHKGANKT